MRYLESIFLSVILLCGLIIPHAPYDGIWSAGKHVDSAVASPINNADNNTDKNSGDELLLRRIKCTNETGKVNYQTPSERLTILMNVVPKSFSDNVGDNSDISFTSGYYCYQEFLYATPLRAPPYCC